jgi:hypothetical protein
MNREDTWVLQDVSDSDTSSTAFSDMITINRNIENRTISIGSCSSSSSLDNMSIYRSQSKDEYDDFNKNDKTIYKNTKDAKDIKDAKDTKEVTDEKQERIRDQTVVNRRKTPTPTNFLRLLKENEKLIQNTTKLKTKNEQS